MRKSSKFSAEVRERAVRLVFEHQHEHESQWAAIGAIAVKIGCTAETLRKWVRQAERDAGKRAGLTTGERERLKELERENRELTRANEILRKASFADRRCRPVAEYRPETMSDAGSRPARSWPRLRRRLLLGCAPLFLIAGSRSRSQYS